MTADSDLSALLRAPWPRRLRVDPNPRERPHVLILTRPDPDDPAYAEWEIEHHDECPRVCYTRPRRPDPLGLLAEVSRPLYDPGFWDCYAEWEITYNGLDALLDLHGNEWRTHRHNLDGARGLDETLPEGRYLIEAWYQSGEGMGEYGGMGDPDGGLTLLGPETP